MRIVMRRTASRILWSVFIVVAIVGCAEERDLNDLKQFVEMTHRDTAPKVDPLPEQVPVISIAYRADQSQDPFAPSNVFGKPQAEVASEPETDPLEPDVSRMPDFLEKFPLDALQMLGTLQFEERNWALIRAPDGEIHRVVVGSYLGQNNGKIVAIDQSKGVLEIEERYRGVSGRWEIRSNEMRSGR
ncbi:MAG TPA: pilus assembly protein PilP [Gammaproteobacteria bacterium]|nr:pilus assembly protein PilP [Gammaproteobacteria bacterium]|tara:strand:- start:184 stop:744 length:561 start_codon:yes stop_codon:yes gene_type:complete